MSNMEAFFKQSCHDIILASDMDTLSSGHSTAVLLYQTLLVTAQ